MSKILDRVADAGGLLFLVLLTVGYGAFVAPFMPESLADPDEVLRHLQENPPTASFWVGVAMEATGLFLFVLFAARLAGRIRANDPTGWMPSAVVALAAGAFAVKLSGFAPSLAVLNPDRYDAGTVTALLGINDVAYGISWALDGALALTLGLGALAVGALPRWISALAVAAGLALLVGTAVPELFESLQMVFLVWVLATSGWLLVRGGRTPATTRPAVPAQVSV